VASITPLSSVKAMCNAMALPNVNRSLHHIIDCSSQIEAVNLNVPLNLFCSITDASGTDNGEKIYEINVVLQRAFDGDEVRRLQTVNPPNSVPLLIRACD